MENTISASVLSEALANLALSGKISETTDTTMTDLTDEISEFNDRTAEVRDARLAHAILCVDKDIPENLDDSIKEHLQKHTSIDDASSLGPMSFLVSEHYMEFKELQAAKKATEKNLPRSKGRSALSSMVPDSYMEFKAQQAAKKATEKKLPRSKAGIARSARQQ